MGRLSLWASSQGSHALLRVVMGSQSWPLRTASTSTRFNKWTRQSPHPDDEKSGGDVMGYDGYVVYGVSLIHDRTDISTTCRYGLNRRIKLKH